MYTTVYMYTIIVYKVTLVHDKYILFTGNITRLLAVLALLTIVQSYTGKYQGFVAVCIVTSAHHE